MRTVVLVLGLAFLVPAFSDDCDNCLDCKVSSMGRKTCHKCGEGYALRKIYVRRLCVCQSKCWGGKENGIVWDPVLRTYICDRKIDCTAFSNCAECLSSGSCAKCKKNFALKLRFKDRIGYNLCDRNCEKCVEPQSGAQICKTSAASCAPLATQRKTPSLATTASVVTEPKDDTSSSTQTTPNPEPTTESSTDFNDYTEPTAD